MQTHRMHSVIRIAAIVLLAVTSASCSRLTSSTDYELHKGDTVPGNLFVISGNVTLDEGSQVTGSVFMLCCNLIVRGEVDGDVDMLTGNIQVAPQATIRGTVRDLFGDQGPTGFLEPARASLRILP